MPSLWLDVSVWNWQKIQNSVNDRNREVTRWRNQKMAVKVRQLSVKVFRLLAICFGDWFQVCEHSNNNGYLIIIIMCMFIVFGLALVYPVHVIIIIIPSSAKFCEELVFFFA